MRERRVFGLLERRTGDCRAEGQYPIAVRIRIAARTSPLAPGLRAPLRGSRSPHD